MISAIGVCGRRSSRGGSLFLHAFHASRQRQSSESKLAPIPGEPSAGWNAQMTRVWAISPTYPAIFLSIFRPIQCPFFCLSIFLPYHFSAQPSFYSTGFLSSRLSIQPSFYPTVFLFKSPYPSVFTSSYPSACP